MTEYPETGYDPDRYPPRQGGDPGQGGALYGGGPRHTRDDESAPGQDSTQDTTASIRGRVWRPTRGPRAEGAADGTNPGYGAPQRGWRTSDGGYRSADGGWRAPYRPYDTGEWRRDQGPDTGPTSTGDMPRYSSGTGEIARYTPPVTGEPPGYRAGAPDTAHYPGVADRAEETPRYPGGTGEIVRYRGGVPTSGSAPTSGMARYPASGVPRYPASGAPQPEVPGTGEIVPYRGGPAEGPRYPGGARDAGYPGGARDAGYPGGARGAGRERRRTGETGEVTRYPGAAGPGGTGETARYSAAPGTRSGREAPRYLAEPDGSGRVAPRTFETDGRGRTTPRPFDTDGSGRATPRTSDTDGRGLRAGNAGPMPNGAGAPRRYPAGTGETTRIPRQLPTSSAGYPAAPPKRRPPEGGGRRRDRDDSAELYSYDPLTLGGGDSPAMHYDRATESYTYDAPPADPPVPPSGVPDPRRTAGGARAANPRPVSPDTGAYGSPPGYRREQPPAVREDPPVPPARRPVERPYQPPSSGGRGPVGRPQQRFEGTYPTRSVRNPRNVVPPRGRPTPAFDDEDADEAPGYVHTALVTTAWYTIPLLLYTMYVLTLDGSAEAGDGASARENALNGLLGGMPRVGVALVTSLVVALLIRVISKGWRAATIGFASAVVGAGVATVIFTALQG